MTPPDPTSHAPDMLATPAHVIRDLAYQVGYARERVLQGDWTEAYSRKWIVNAGILAETRLRKDHGCKLVTIYANLTTGFRALLIWSFVDRNGDKFADSIHPTL